MSTAASAAEGCLACDGPVAAGRDWCCRGCRAALRRYGSALAPTAARGEQLDRALAQRRTLRGVMPLHRSYRERGG